METRYMVVTWIGHWQPLDQPDGLAVLWREKKDAEEQRRKILSDELRDCGEQRNPETLKVIEVQVPDPPKGV